MAEFTLFQNGERVTEPLAEGDLGARLADPGMADWLDLPAPDPALIDRIGEALGLHELAVEDAGDERQRPKLDRYDSHLFLTVHRVVLDEQDDLLVSELAVFVTPHALVTVHKDTNLHPTDVARRWAAAGRERGIDYLLYALLDAVVDSHFDAAQALEDEVEELEDLLFAEPSQLHTVQRRSLRLRKNLLRLSRVAAPLREVLLGLMHRDIGLIDERLMPYYQDVYDHVLRVTEWVEGMRELASGVRETQLALQGNRLNVVMKKVTSWAAIIAVPTAVTGYFGQNLPYPGYGDHAGLIGSYVAILGSSLVLYLLFRRRGWL
ncbi:magnesium transporter CorA family protein [Actinoalloteichus sp. GBA129-24]|uniref:magnesium transporter CorA family protein n=1 Tax=Actinoalloteichus sp. GBA129-24 TaxID=1612551 RepID=UPI0009503707|nr:magnesium transporter CorA family protein [Actinoalloteichus sp. GBA129-24]APU19273.1 Mg2+/Co2+ transporter [Actinoalloteichus sp. GBA129-24]